MSDAVVGVVLAGGLGRRIGGDKALVELDGRPLLAYPLATLGQCGFDQLAVVAKRATRLPALADEIALWLEPDTPRHPLTGIVHALGAARGRAVFVVAADMALLDVTTIARVLGAHEPGDRAVVPRADGRLQPLCALYAPSSLAALRLAARDASLTASVAALAPRIVEVADATPFFNVNAPEDLRRAGALRQL
jgi:molybdopterin-guanine dinucleotide biosynthesis protein A